MARVFKFRAFNNGQMSKPFTFGEGVCWPNGSVSTANKIGTVMQFTGLKDKNGNEIYEDDIFRSDSYPFNSEGNDNYHGLIVFDDADGYSGWYYLPEPISHRVRGAACGGLIGELELSTVEIIGNVHENPELLERPLNKERGAGTRE